MRPRFTLPTATARLSFYLAVWIALAIIRNTPCAAEALADVNGAKEIVVTAQRRPEHAHDVPIFITALSGKELEQTNATETPSLGKVVPSLVMMRTGAPTQPYLRGVGKRSTLGVENSVATYVDGVYIASSLSALLDLRGIERVEVLNGPQGTLFGRNTTGGVIQIVTRDPTSEASAETSIDVGSYGYIRGDAYVTGGTDQLAGNVALSLYRHGGYGTNFFTGKKDVEDTRHSLVTRSKWIWRPAGSVKATLAADYQDIDQDFSQLPVVAYPPLGEPRVLDFRDSDQNSPVRYRFRYGGVSLRTDVDIGTVTFMSLSAARKMHALYGADLDAGPQPLLAAAPNAYQDQLSQEFQVQSSASARFKWLAGFYYIHIQERYDPTNFDYGGLYSARLGGRIEQLLYDTGTTSSYAGYGQATLSLGDKTRLTAGLRYTIEDKAVSAKGEQFYTSPPLVRPIGGLPLPTETPFRNSADYRELTWHASLDRNFSGTLMGYISTSRGFQSGGWNLQTPQIPPFRPETLDDFEGGLKYLSLSRRFSADVGAFYYDYANLQVSAFTPLGSITTNATSATIYGVDIQADVQLDNKSSLTFGAQLLAAHYNSFRNATCTNYDPNAPILYAPVSCDASGNRLPFAPKFKFNLGADHWFGLGSRGALLLTGNLAYNSGYFSEADNVVRQHAFGTVDLSVEWQPPRGRNSARLWIANLTNAHYYDSLVTFPTTGVLQRPAAPRRFGVTLARTF